MKNRNVIIISMISVLLIFICSLVSFALAESTDTFGSDGIFYAAYNLKTGVMRLIGSPDQYNAKIEDVISWNQQGPPGQPGSSGTNTLEDCPVGTQYACYPSEPFDFIAKIQSGWDNDAGVPLYTDVPIHISTFTAELRSKNSFESFSQNPVTGIANEGTFVFRPYTSIVKIVGQMDPGFAGKQIQVAITTSYDSLNLDWIGTYPLTVDSTGNFVIEQERYWNTPVSIWFAGLYIPLY